MFEITHTVEAQPVSIDHLSTARPAPGPIEYGLLGALALAWGTSFMFTKVAVSELGPFSLVSVRMLFAAVLLLALLAFRRPARPISRRDYAFFALLGLISNTLPLGLIALSVSHVDSSVTATTMALVPLATMALAMFTGEYPTVKRVIGLIVGLMGVGVLFGPQAFASFDDGAKGALAAFGAALAFSISLFAMKHVQHHAALTVATMSLFAAALWSVPMALLFEGIPDALPSGRAIGAIIVLSLYNTAAANLLLFALVPRTGASFTAINNYIVPAIAVLCGSVFLGETITARGLLGVAVVLTGVAISTFNSRARGVAVVPPITP